MPQRRRRPKQPPRGQGDLFMGPAGGPHHPATPSKPTVPREERVAARRPEAEKQRSGVKPVFTVTVDRAAHVRHPTILISKIDLSGGKERARSELAKILASAKTKGYVRIECWSEDTSERAFLAELGFRNHRQTSRVSRDENEDYYYWDIH